MDNGPYKDYKSRKNDIHYIWTKNLILSLKYHNVLNIK